MSPLTIRLLERWRASEGMQTRLLNPLRGTYLGEVRVGGEVVSSHVAMSRRTEMTWCKMRRSDSDSSKRTCTSGRGVASALANRG
jgi:hypothetical protein